MPSCVFCAIVGGDIPGRTVYETDDVLAFLDANPLAPGHTLVIPKGHYERLTDVPPALAPALMEAIYRVTAAAATAVEADGTTIAFNDGEAAGQEVPHVHGHVIPRFEGDGGGPIHAIAGQRPTLTDEELDEIADAIAGET